MEVNEIALDLDDPFPASPQWLGRPHRRHSRKGLAALGDDQGVAVGGDLLQQPQTLGLELADRHGGFFHASRVAACRAGVKAGDLYRFKPAVQLMITVAGIEAAAPASLLTRNRFPSDATAYWPTLGMFVSARV